ncbi:site-specific DNA-methyltransferase [Campylobacter upsaliensis]|nr:site-specific DNA-methyltransferase [Campylobacter upsaliensis]
MKNELLQDLENRFETLKHIRNLAQSYDEKLFCYLLEQSTYKNEFKNRFFIMRNNTYIFKLNDFLTFLDLRNLSGSFTSYTNKIGLGFKTKSFLKTNNEVVLNFAYKDGVIKGGQSKDEDKKNEIFFNEILAKDEIDVLFARKALQNFELIGQGDLKENLNNANLLIKGNNLLALHSLKKKFANKVKLIYIDPPYNTGNDSFNYNDNFNHSTWLTFMKNRLEIAREFLSDDGVIFIQCDDNEQAYLKVLCDEIFGRDNFVGCMVWLKGNAQNDADTMQRNQEYILCYAKKIESKPLYKIKQKVKVKAFKDEKTGRFYYEGAGLTMGGGDGGSLENRPNLGYTFYYNPQTKDIKPLLDYDKDSVKTITNHDELYNDNEELIKQGYVPIRPPKMGVGNGRWKWALEKTLNELDRILIKAGKNGYSVLRKEWLDSKQVKQDENGDYYAIIEKENPPKSFADFVGSGVGSKENKAIFNTKVFNNPKPEALMKYIIEISTKGAEVSCDDFVGCQARGEGSLLNINDRAESEDSRKSTQETTPDLVMDFFAGSGTTLAVAMKMKRQFIGIEQMDYIESITKERLKKVINGEQGGISKALNWQGGGSFIYAELMPLNVAYKERIKNINDEKELEKLYNDLESKAFLDYRIDLDSILKDKEFKELDLQNKQEALLKILDSNMDYVLYGDIQDEDYAISSEVIELNKIFYGDCHDFANAKSRNDKKGK